MVNTSEVFGLGPGAYGDSLPESVRDSLEQAARHYLDTDTASAHLQDALSLGPDCLAVYFAGYKFYFYKKRFVESEEMARRGLAVAAAQGGFPDDWRVLGRSSESTHPGPWSEPGSPQYFYLFTFKALAFIRLRQHDAVKCEALQTTLARLDPADRVGASVIRTILQGTTTSDENDTSAASTRRLA